jgi:hypothetical protein
MLRAAFVGLIFVAASAQDIFLAKTVVTSDATKASTQQQPLNVQLPPNVSASPELKMDEGTVKVDTNTVIVMASARTDDETYVTLLTPDNNWVCHLTVSGGLTFGVDVAAGNHAGQQAQMDPSIANWANLKYANTGVGALQDDDYLHVTFLKPKFLGVLTDYGTLSIPASQSKGKNVFVFWPKDAPGDAWTNFVNDLDAIAGVTEKIKEIGSNLLDIVKNGEAMAAAVGL